ncbi:MAG: PTS sugar transporter subunit IIC [Gemmatimonadales bacterium]
MIESLPLVLALMAWGTIVGVDLVTFPQAMISRPLVAGTVSGLLGAWLFPGVEGGSAITAGIAVGAVLELYALDVLPIGAARYPDYGPATVSAVYAALGVNLMAGLGAAVLCGLLVAVLGGWLIQWVRRANARAIQHRAAGLAAGDAAALRRLHRGGVTRDIARSAALMLIGLTLANLIWPVLPRGAENLTWLTIVAVGGGLAAALGGAVRSAGRTRRSFWLAAGLSAGLLVVLLT